MEWTRMATLERTFGVDLGAVRVHTDARAAGAAASLSARAFAHGQQIALGAGERPTDVGLMAHEVAHVVHVASLAFDRLRDADDEAAR